MSEPDTPTAAASGNMIGRPGQYRHDPDRVPAMAQAIDLACADATDLHEAALVVSDLLRNTDAQAGEPAATALLHTLMYIIEVAPADKPADATLQPVTGPSLLPTALRDAGDELHHLWRDLAAAVRHPIARARCWDIVFTLRLSRNTRDAAARAIRAYLDCTATTLSRQNQASGLVRAWTIARLVGVNEFTAELTAALMAIADTAVNDQTDAYAAIRALSALAAPPPRGIARQPDPAVDNLLDRALTAYPQVHVIRDIAMLIRRHAGNDTVRIANAGRHEVSVMLAEAEAATDPLIIRTLFADAASAARRLGLTDLEQTAVTRLQSAPPVPWTYQEYSVTTPVPFFDYLLPGFKRAVDWRQALGIWLHTRAPSGRFEDNEANARRAANTTILYRLATVVMFRDGDLPSRRVSEEQARAGRELARQEHFHLEQNGRLLARALMQIRERFGIASRSEIETFLRDEFGAAPGFVTTWTTALHLFWIGEYTASTHLAVPMVEAAARALLLELNEPLYRTAVGDSSGQFPGLGSLLEPLLDNDFDPDWERFLRTLLLNDGNNLRNLVAHGFVRQVSPDNAALVLRAAALLMLITNPAAVARDDATVRAALAKPAGPPPSRPWWLRLVAAVTAARQEIQL